MPGSKLPILTITNKEYFRDDGLYIYSSADGQLDIIADTTAKITAPTVEIESSTGITLDGDTTVDTGHKFIFSNDGVGCSSNAGTANLWDTVTNLSGSTSGWLKVTAGSYTAYIPLYSGNKIL